MIYLPADDAPEYDLTMELLCSIPPRPGHARLTDLCEDFGWSRHDEAMREINSLISCGYHVTVTRVRGEGRAVRFRDERASSYGQWCGRLYWRKVYAGGGAAS